MAAGTLFGIGLSQQVDANGRPLAGALLYLYQANTSTPVTAYKNVGLTAGQEHPWPIPADANGRIPAFWLDASINYRARLTDEDGIVQFDEPNILPIGAVSGGGGVDSTDPNSVNSTGDVKWRPWSNRLAGWVRMNGRTIGSATSGANERANADCQLLFEHIWNNFSDALCPVVTGRGANSTADWGANKQITLLDMRGRSPYGVSDMGSTDSARLDGTTSAAGTKTTGGGAGGTDTHTLTTAQLSVHQHDAFINETAHSHGPGGLGGGFMTSAEGGLATPTSGNPYGVRSVTAAVSTGVRVKSSSGGAADDKTANAGSGSAHPNMPPFMVGTWYWRL